MPSGAALTKLHFPCIAFLRFLAEPVPDQAGQGPESTGDEVPTQRPVLFIKADAERLLYFVAGEQAPRTIALAEAQSLFESGLLLVAHETKPEALSPDDPAATAGAGREAQAHRIRVSKVRDARKNRATGERRCD